MKLASLLKLAGKPRINLLALILAAVAMPTSSNSVFADDYNIAAGVDSYAGKDAGTIECGRDVRCSLRLKPYGLRISVYPSRVQDTATVWMDGDEADCCYFDGAVRSVVIAPGGKLSQLPIYRGREAKGAVFIQNECVGILYLRIHRR